MDPIGLRSFQADHSASPCPNGPNESGCFPSPNRSHKTDVKASKQCHSHLVSGLGFAANHFAPRAPRFTKSAAVSFGRTGRPHLQVEANDEQAICILDAEL